MTVYFRNSSGTDLDNVFDLGEGNKLVYAYTSSGQDLGQCYYDVSKGSPAGTQNFRNSAGTDFGNLFCKKGTYKYKGILTCGYLNQYGNASYGYLLSSKIGSYTGYRANGAAYPRLLSFYSNYGGWLCMNFDDSYKPSGGSTIYIDLKWGSREYKNVALTWGSVSGGRDRYRLNYSNSTYPTKSQINQMFSGTNVIEINFRVRDL